MELSGLEAIMGIMSEGVRMCRARIIRICSTISNPSIEHTADIGGGVSRTINMLQAKS